MITLIRQLPISIELEQSYAPDYQYPDYSKELLL